MKPSPSKLTRQEIYELFSRVGYRAPAHGLVTELAPAIIATAWEESNPMTGRPLQQGPYTEPQVVLYTDEYASGGNGMVLMSAQEALDKYPGNYCSEFLHSGDKASEAIRLLQVGCRRWLLKYRNPYDWKASLGECEVAVMYEQEARYVDEIPYPLWAVDFIQVGRYGLLAVDFTREPSTEPISGVVTKSEISSLVKDAERFFTR